MLKEGARYLIAVFAALWIIKEVAVPLGAAAIYSNEYMNLVIQCDTAMDSSWYFSQSQPNDPSEKISLLICHDYDKVRKKMLIAGLPEDYLAWLGLKSLELEQRSAEEFVTKHRFSER